MTNGINNALDAESNHNNEQLDTHMIDIESSPPPPVTQPGEHEYDEKIAESPSEFDSIISDAETKKRLAETTEAMAITPRKREP